MCDDEEDWRNEESLYHKREDENEVLILDDKESKMLDQEEIQIVLEKRESGDKRGTHLEDVEMLMWSDDDDDDDENKNNDDDVIDKTSSTRKLRERLHCDGCDFKSTSRHIITRHGLTRHQVKRSKPKNASRKKM